MAKKPARATAVDARHDYAARLVALADQLGARADLDDVTLRLGAKAAKVRLERAASNAFPEPLQALYAAHDGLHFAWQERGTRVPGGGREHVFGRLRLLPLLDGYSGGWGGTLGFSGEPSEDPDISWYHGFANGLRALDAPEPEEVTRLVCFAPFRRPKAKGKAVVEVTRLWWFDSKGPKFPLALDAASYLEEALVACGIDGWQCLFADFEAMPASEHELRYVVVDKAERVLGHLHRLFADRSWDEHEARVRKLREQVGS